jgi:hypothetical protein
MGGLPPGVIFAGLLKFLTLFGIDWMSKEKDEQLAKALARILYLENRVAILEEENVGTTNALYEMENRLQSQLDAIVPRMLKFKPDSAV